MPRASSSSLNTTVVSSVASASGVSFSFFAAFRKSLGSLVRQPYTSFRGAFTSTSTVCIRPLWVRTATVVRPFFTPVTTPSLLTRAIFLSLEAYL